MVFERGLITVLLSSTLCLAVSGCGNDKEATYKSGGMTHTMAEGKDAVPKDFPLPIYANAAPTGSVSAQGSGDEQSKYLILTSADSIDKVSEYYQNELKTTGWNIENVQVTPKLVSISATKKDKNLESNVLINDDGGKTTISLQSTSAVEIKKEDEEPTENFSPNKVTPPTD